jgi:hypothetical protein
MNLIKFAKHYPDEESCTALMKKYREKKALSAVIVGARNIVGVSAYQRLNVNNEESTLP